MQPTTYRNLVGWTGGPQSSHLTGELRRDASGILSINVHAQLVLWEGNGTGIALQLGINTVHPLQAWGSGPSTWCLW